jgi:preprotein translocase subunit SecA
VSAIPEGVRAHLQALSGGPVQRKLAAWSLLLPKIAAYEPELQKHTDQELRKRSLSLRYRAKAGESLDKMLPEAFALVREAGFRTLNMRHFDVQMLGGIAMHNRSVAEMQTGEGKTLTATLPLYLNALSGKGVHLATVNDYLARRDAEWMRPLFESLGMSVGVIETPMKRPERAKNYACDVTYGTAKEFGFDFCATGCCCGGSPRGSRTCSARCSASRASKGANSRCSATRGSPWSTRPTAS